MYRNMQQSFDHLPFAASTPKVIDAVAAYG
jgi:hypothetical protein